MGLISRVSSRTYRKFRMFALRRFSSSAMRRSDPIQAIFVGKIQEYSKLAAAGKLDQAEVQAEIDAAKARLGGSGDMKAFPALAFADSDLSAGVAFSLE